MHISKFDMKALKIDSDKIILDESIRLILQYKEKKGKYLFEIFLDKVFHTRL